MAKIGGEGRLRGQWGCMFKSGVSIVNFMHPLISADLGPTSFSLKNIFQLTIRYWILVSYVRWLESVITSFFS